MTLSRRKDAGLLHKRKFQDGATPKEAQNLARHEDPDLTMNVYARSQDDRLKTVAEEVGRSFLGGFENTKSTQKEKAEAGGDSPISGSETAYGDDAVVEAAGIEPVGATRQSTPIQWEFTRQVPSEGGVTGDSVWPHPPHTRKPADSQKRDFYAGIMRDPQLRELIEAWRFLSPEMRRSILTLAKHSRKTGAQQTGKKTSET